MLRLLQSLISYFKILWLISACRAAHPEEPAHYQKLPSLREQAKIEQAWRAERIARIPKLLQKYNADAWLVSCQFDCVNFILTSIC